MTQSGEPAFRVVAGERVELRRNTRRRRNAAARREEGRIVVELPPAVPPAEEEEWLARMVDLVQRREKRRRSAHSDEDLMRRARELHTRYLVSVAPDAPLPQSVGWVDNQNRRWGSCTIGARTIRLSHRLQGMPDWVVAYVLFHELVHLVEAGHGPAFRRLLGAYPRTAEAEAYLQGWSDAVARGSDEDAAGDIDEDCH
ncbi:M48 family metallopeptidase [Ammonicoccus fulvus]|uniref:M48 family metallopeptidase n=1 Tax=Ammonicoccus fulvus TaxID=3138240 RepID=A0ABZ3FQ31_9ACTN